MNDHKPVTYHGTDTPVLSGERAAQTPSELAEPAGSVLVGQVIVGICDVCGRVSNHWAEDEDDRIWCSDCTDKWERDNNADWGSGQPKAPNNSGT